MNQYRDAAQTIRQYFESYGRLASAKGLSFTGMPIGGDNDGQARMQANHGDLVIKLKDLTREELGVCSLYYAAAAGTKRYFRYVRTAHDAHPDEQITKRSHPDDPTMIEVTGSMTRGCDVVEVARIMGLSQNRANQLLSWARTKVAKRLEAEETE